MTLVGVTVHRCPECGEYEVEIPRIEELHAVIARALASKKAKMAPAEIRYLRKYLGFSGGEFAKVMGTTPETVSRWESGKQIMAPPAERVLRLLVFLKKPIEEYPPERLAEVAQGQPSPLRVKVREVRDTWAVAA